MVQQLRANIKLGLAIVEPLRDRDCLANDMGGRTHLGTSQRLRFRVIREHDLHSICSVGQLFPPSRPGREDVFEQDVGIRQGLHALHPVETLVDRDCRGVPDHAVSSASGGSLRIVTASQDRNLPPAQLVHSPITLLSPLPRFPRPGLLPVPLPTHPLNLLSRSGQLSASRLYLRRDGLLILGHVLHVGDLIVEDRFGLFDGYSLRSGGVRSRVRGIATEFDGLALTSSRGYLLRSLANSSSNSLISLSKSDTSLVSLTISA
jgi:hypothetical protein